MSAVHAFLLLAQLGGTALSVADRDIPYFQKNPTVMRETLRKCHQDYRLAQTPECQNAEAAATRGLGKPLPPGFSPDNPPPKPDVKVRERAS
jgi:hypothetical protein